jgi:hypothetical protein
MVLVSSDTEGVAIDPRLLSMRGSSSGETPGGEIHEPEEAFLSERPRYILMHLIPLCETYASIGHRFLASSNIEEEVGSPEEYVVPTPLRIAPHGLTHALGCHLYHLDTLCSHANGPLHMRKTSEYYRHVS